MYPRAEDFYDPVQYSKSIAASCGQEEQNFLQKFSLTKYLAIYDLSTKVTVEKYQINYC